MNSLITYIGFLAAILLAPNNEISYSPISETTCNSSFSKKVEIREVKRYGGDYGYSVWMEQKGEIKAHFKTKQRSTRKEKAKEKIILQTTAAFVNDTYAAAIGLTIENGQLLNQKINDKMDALVIIHEKTVMVVDLRAAFYFQPMNRLIDLSNVLEKERFLSWASENDLTAFQTHLLAHQNEMKIGEEGNARKATRKFLVIWDNEGKEKFFIVFYLNNGEYLQKATKYIFDYLDTKNGYIHAIINLDTGIQDVLELNDNLRICNDNNVKGSCDKRLATNLLTFYYW